MSYSKPRRRWEGRWAVPWNAPAGKYTLKATVPDVEIKETYFNIIRPEKYKMPETLSVVTWENMRRFRRIKMTGPDGEVGGWKKIFDWLQWMGADTFWFIAGQTSAYLEKLCPSFPWNSDNLSMLEEVINEAHRRGIKTGAWISCYYTFGPKKYQPDYKRGWDYKRGRNISIPTDAISILDEKRLKEIIEFAKKLEKIDKLDYIGLDYIPDDYGGMELVDEFVHEMDIDVPDDWEDKSFKERMNWLGRIVKRTTQRKIPLIDKWNWWRAHRISSIIKDIKDGAEITKPLWAFVLSWEKGWQHGQDAVMFQSAGVDINAVMLYQADRKQFDFLLSDWNRYIKKDDANIIVGNQIDWFWHQRTLSPPGPEEFYDRLLMGKKSIYNDGEAKGIFINDLSRAFWGSRGPYPAKEWLIASAAAFSRLRERHHQTPVKTQVIISSYTVLGEVEKCKVLIENISGKELKNLVVSLELPADGIISTGETKKEIESLASGESTVLKFEIKGVKHDENREGRWMVASRTTGIGKPNFSFTYIDVKKR